MITFDWELKDGYWTVIAKLDDDVAEVMEDLGEGYKPFPTLQGKGIAGGRDLAASYALEDLAKQIQEDVNKSMSHELTLSEKEVKAIRCLLEDSESPESEKLIFSPLYDAILLKFKARVKP